MPSNLPFWNGYIQQAELTGADVVNCAHNMVDMRGTRLKRLKGTPGIRTGERAAYELLQDELSPTLGIKSFAVLFSTMFVTPILSAPKMNVLSSSAIWRHRAYQ